jgi:uncharacterized protein with NAD-binding domain and iron-sulfur cluster
MTKKKIAILGGGMAALSAAYQLTKTQALRDQYDVTVYSFGWRLGGKAASGRDALGRNLEHWLHVWFGCYENTFQMLQELYAANPPGGKLPNWQAAVKPQTNTPIGVLLDDGTWAYWPSPRDPGVVEARRTEPFVTPSATVPATGQSFPTLVSNARRVPQP